MSPRGLFPPAGRIWAVHVLLISADPAVREQMAVSVRGVERAVGETVEFLWASDGVRGIAIARQYRPDIVVADEISSRAGAFAVAQDLKAGELPFPGVVVILLEREQDEWLAAWSGADAWFVKPIDPFAFADRVTELLGGSAKEAV
jgi:DNA-binding response OmpR family regulator